MWNDESVGLYYLSKILNQCSCIILSQRLFEKLSTDIPVWFESLVMIKYKVGYNSGCTQWTCLLEQRPSKCHQSKKLSSPISWVIRQSS